MDPYKNVKVNRFEINEEEVKKVLEKLKTGKSAGLDRLSVELYKELINDRRAIEKLTAIYEKVLEEKKRTNRMEEIKNNHDSKKEQTNRNRTETNSND